MIGGIRMLNNKKGFTLVGLIKQPLEMILMDLIMAINCI
jgi:hypothetical protein